MAIVKQDSAEVFHYVSEPAAALTETLRSGEGDCYLLLESEQPLRTLSSAPWGGGFGLHRRLINRQVDKSYMCEDPLAEMDDFLNRSEIEPAGTACLLTSVHMNGIGRCHMRWNETGPARAEAAYEAGPSGDIAVSVWVTVGYSNKARAGRVLAPAALFPGTINVIVVIEGKLTDAAMVNAVITATEAKAAALQDLGVAMEDGSAATGTTTDAVLIAATQSGRAHLYAGTATLLGHMIGRAVYEAAMDSGRIYAQVLAGLGSGEA
ncbi:adenosylcobinamide amidohydrolase [Paenibacillus sp. FJAT-26967]|uniref:adenosylcobinamide amidohydrolase n=1 Tax=Paenibacillus sp. FJAT-26967 TaxID=1729690 RepID=UPI000B2D39E3|nr:adenosylcobinamide amidohydrolase [Paenibacillus sp. FJAT-26967]